MIQTGGITKEPQVRNSITQLLNSVESLKLFITDVEDRFSSVLRREEKVDSTEINKDTEEPVSFAMELNKIRTEINMSNDRLRSILARCEL